ncbi:hypothetical protein BBO99_00003755 [Phytophthora kernoviae]|uniref:Uncharacterized protein n=2 Tax=Phytophthora kernoviae TaxID=325452 RepID=A0A3R7JFP9_9STRA|nr:hypothetical protein G195_004336 [Phytophthora kernoviae 00238/432]KAG2527496.1 hypothetical protein JM16_003416 [Phytophthora kernoviae]KAG2528767.1 hypothetical protein JM18_002989 [Phytophthora kernoviae]RLN45116.1 hypothetical protein BBI17_003845 [Phytophthora kernoviae]RLN81378.1 hypothetical protein BBO99_00003755 [Phytophthora kernoviae]
MTLFFVISPAQIESGNSYRGQKFFGNSPYGQFALHGGKPSFFANNGLDESNYILPVGQFSLLMYRVHRNSVEIKVNDRPWSGKAGVDENRVRISANDAISLGNVKSSCDTNAFQAKPIDEISDTTHEVATEDLTPAPKFDLKVNIFEWRPPNNADQTKVAEWMRTVKEKVDFIRNFQLGGDVLRALIRQHHDELMSLREVLFG